ncbi:MAG TPA: DUF1464 family protein [Phycisphaerales bacterium]|nr:DUF1464 family protein [Phycisphaerales bacterium]
MPRVIGIDPGTVSLDLCGLAGGRVYLDASWPTAEALADPEGFLARLTSAGPPDLVVGPSGYGLPLRRAADASERDLRLAYLAAPDEAGGIGGLRAFVRRLAATALPMVLVPGVVHLDTVPEYRKLNRVDLGTADKVCAAALAIREVQERTGRPTAAVSLLLLELGGAFTAGLAVRDGQIVDGIGGTSGPIGWRAAGALDGEVAFLAGEIGKDTLFGGGVETVSGRAPGLRAAAVEAFVEGALKAARQLMVAVPEPDVILLSGRHAEDRAVFERLARALIDAAPVRRLEGFAVRAKQGAQGAAVLADGLAGGEYAPLVDRLRIREARGTVLDHLYVITPEQAARRLGLDRNG